MSGQRGTAATNEQPGAPRAARVAASYRGVTKSFGAVQALKPTDLDFVEGTVHALVGENGAGKSTCLGVLGGRVAPSEGKVEVFGKPLSFGTPRASHAAGVAAIYQELMTVGTLSAHANVFLGQTISRGGLLAEREMRDRYLELCERLKVRAVPADVPASKLAVADQQILEIMRALVSDARIILFDEPTAALAAPERRALLDLMDGLRGEGLTLAFVSHNLDEVLEISDTVSVFRNGQLVATEPVETWSKLTLVKEMTGQAGDNRVLNEYLEESVGAEQAAEIAPVETKSRRPKPSGGPILVAEGIELPGALEGLDLELAAGEILGLGGVVGSGRTSTLRVLAGLEPRAKGRLWIDGKEVSLPSSVRAARRYGIALLPEDRKNQGLALGLDAADNITMANFGGAARFGIMSRRRSIRLCEEPADQVSFNRGRLNSPAGALSGGNQQKLLVARWLYQRPRILLVDEPTRGVDINAKAEIIASIEAIVSTGVACVFVSSELEEVTAVSDRIAVVVRGRVVAQMDSEDSNFHASAVLGAAFQVDAKPASEN
jgi:ABC-type sugar transport system ATPase subunit